MVVVVVVGGWMLTWSDALSCPPSQPLKGHDGRTRPRPRFSKVQAEVAREVLQ